MRKYLEFLSGVSCVWFMFHKAFAAFIERCVAGTRKNKFFWQSTNVTLAKQFIDWLIDWMID